MKKEQEAWNKHSHQKKESPSSDDLVHLKAKGQDEIDDPTLTDPGAEAGDDGDYIVEDPVLGHTGREVEVDQNPNLSGSYSRGPEIVNSWANG
jgi:hypothetical protein